MAAGPVWSDPRYMTAQRLRQLEAHEEQIRQRERDREWRRMQPLMHVNDSERWSDDFLGCVE